MIRFSLFVFLLLQLVFSFLSLVPFLLRMWSTLFFYNVSITARSTSVIHLRPCFVGTGIAIPEGAFVHNDFFLSSPNPPCSFRLHPSLKRKRKKLKEEKREKRRKKMVFTLHDGLVPLVEATPVSFTYFPTSHALGNNCLALQSQEQALRVCPLEGLLLQGLWWARYYQS